MGYKKKTIKDVNRIVTLQLARLKKQQYKEYGIGIPKCPDAHRLDGLISALAWVKVFAIDDETYNPQTMEGTHPADNYSLKTKKRSGNGWVDMIFPKD